MRSAPMRTAGARWSSARFDTASMWFDSANASGYTRRSCGTPARSAASVEHSTNPAAWSTFHCEQCHLVYGAASIGFFADGCSRNSGATGSRRHASGLSAAVRLNAGPELRGGAGVLGHGLAERGAQRGLDRRVHQRRAHEAGGALGRGDDLVGRLDALVGRDVVALHGVVHRGSGDVRCAGRGTWPRRPRRSRRRGRRSAMARHARVNGVDCSTPSSAITDCALAPTRSATIRPGSR